MPDLHARGIGPAPPIQSGQLEKGTDDGVNRIPVLDVKKSESLAKNLSLVVALNSQTLPCIKAPTKALLELTQDGFVHCKQPNVLGVSEVSALIQPWG